MRFWALWLTAYLVLVATYVEGEDVLCYSCRWTEGGSGKGTEEDHKLPPGFEKSKNGTGDGEGPRFSFDSSCRSKFPKGTDWCTYGCSWSIYSSYSGKKYIRGCAPASAPSNGCQNLDHVVCYCNTFYCNNGIENTEGGGGGGGGSSSSSRPKLRFLTLFLLFFLSSTLGM